MKVKDLIAELQKLDPEMVVCVTDASEWTGPVGTIEIERFDSVGAMGRDGQPVGEDFVYLTTGDFPPMIYFTLTAATEAELKEKIEAMLRSYPPQGYSTTIGPPKQQADGSWAASGSRYSSCD